MNRAETGMIMKMASAAPVSSVMTGTRKRSRAAGTILRTALSTTVKAQAVTMTPMTPPSPGARLPKSGMVRGWAAVVTAPSAPLTAGMPAREAM